MRYEDIDKEALVKKVGNDIAVKMLMRDFPKEHKAFLAEQDNRPEPKVSLSTPSQPSNQPSTSIVQSTPELKDLNFNSMIKVSSPKETYEAIATTYPEDFDWEGILKVSSLHGEPDYDKAISAVQKELGRFKPKANEESIKEAEDFNKVTDNIEGATGGIIDSNLIKGVQKTLSGLAIDALDVTSGVAKGVETIATKLAGQDNPIAKLAKDFGDDLDTSAAKKQEFNRAVEDLITDEDKEFFSAYTAGQILPTIVSLPVSEGASVLKGILTMATEGIGWGYTASRADGKDKIDSAVDGTVLGLTGAGIGISGHATVNAGKALFKGLTTSVAKKATDTWERDVINSPELKKEFNDYLDKYKNEFVVSKEQTNFWKAEEGKLEEVPDDVYKLMAMTDFIQVKGLNLGITDIDKAIDASRHTATMITKGAEDIKSQIKTLAGAGTEDSLKVVNKINKSMEKYAKNVSKQYKTVYKEASKVELSEGFKGMPKEIDTMVDDIMKGLDATSNSSIASIKSKVKEASTVGDLMTIYKDINRVKVVNDATKTRELGKVKDTIKGYIKDELKDTDVYEKWLKANKDFSVQAELKETAMMKIVDGMTPTTTKVKGKKVTKEAEQSSTVGLRELDKLSRDTGERTFSMLRRVVGKSKADKLELALIGRSLNDNKFSITRLGEAVLNKDLKSTQGKAVQNMVAKVTDMIDIDKVVAGSGENIKSIAGQKNTLDTVLSHWITIKILASGAKVLNAIGGGKYEVGTSDIMTDRLVKLLQNKRTLKKIADDVVGDN